MAFGFKGTGSDSTQNSTIADQATLVVTTATTVGAVGNFAVLIYAIDNSATVDADENAVLSIVDSAGNTWLKGAEFTNGNGAAGAGATSGLWYSNLTVALPISSTITLTFFNATDRDATAASLTYFTTAPGFYADFEGTPVWVADDGAVTSLSVATSNIACLRVRGIASESNSVTALTPTTSFAVMTQSVANSGAAATSMGVRGEWIISISTNTASAPTGGAGAVDNASVYVAFKEVASLYTMNLVM